MHASQQGETLGNPHLNDFQQTCSFWKKNYKWRAFPKPKVRTPFANRELENSGRHSVKN